MARVRLIHWNTTEAGNRAAELRAAGFEVEFDPVTPAALRAFGSHPPHAFVIDLSRLPSHGRDVAASLRGRKSTRHVPLIFVAGDPAKVDRIRALLPDAAYSDWSGIRINLERAMAHPPADPVKLKPLSGYSSPPLPKKLGIRPGTTVSLLGAPEDFEQTLGTLPDGVRLDRRVREETALAILFARSVKDLRRRFDSAVRLLPPKGCLWIAWPKKTSGMQSDLNEAEVRRTGLDAGLVDFKICAIDDTWSGLLFIRRTKRRAAAG